MGAYPAYKKDYEAMVFIDGWDVVAINSDGSVIDHGTNWVDDSDVIQSAIDYVVSATGGGKISIGAGVFVIYTPILVKSYIQLCGEGTTTTLYAETGLDDDVIYIEDQTNCLIENMWIAGNSAGQASGSGIYINHAASTDCFNVVKDVVITDCKEYGVEISSNSDYVSLLNNIIGGCGTAPVSDPTLTSVIRDTYGHTSIQSRRDYDAMVFIEGTSVIAVDSNGVCIARGVAGTDDATVIQAAIDASDSYTFVKNGSYTVTQTIRIEKNGYKIDFDKSTITAGVGIGSIRIISEGPLHNQSVIIVYKSTNVVVENVIIDCDNRWGSNGILVYGKELDTATYPSDNITVRNCDVYRAHDYTRGGTSSANGYGIFLLGSTNSTIDSCYVSECAVGVYSRLYTYAPDPNFRSDCTIKNCTLVDNAPQHCKYLGLGVYAYGHPGLKVLNCDIYGNHRIGIWIGESRTSDLRYMVDGCRINGAYTNGIHLAGSASYSWITNNIVYECGSMGIAFGPSAIVTGNIVFDNGSKADSLQTSTGESGGAGIYAYGGVAGTQISDNLAYDTGVGYQKFGLIAVHTDAHSINIGKNNFTGCEVPYRLRRADVEDRLVANLSTTTGENNTKYIVTSDDNRTLTLPRYSWKGSTIEIVGCDLYSYYVNNTTIEPDVDDVLVVDNAAGKSAQISTSEGILFTNVSSNPRYKRPYGGYGNNNATSNLNGGTIDWSDLSNIEAYNDQFAVATSTSTALTYRILCRRNIGIPSDATILGLICLVGAISTHQDATNYVVDNEVRFMKNDGTLSATNHADTVTKWPLGREGIPSTTVDSAIMYGSNTDLWGETWTPADINGAGFGVVFAVDIVSDGTEVSAMIDRLQVYVVFESGYNIWKANTNGELVVIS